MKRIAPVLATLFIAFGASRPAHAYFDFHLGLQNNEHYGFGVGFGMRFPENLGLDVQIVSNYQNKDLFNVYFIQENVSIFYDFQKFLPSNEPSTAKLHPYAKLGFSYGTNIITDFSVGGVSTGAEMSHGPGLSFGVGCDWKAGDPLSIGLDLYETVLWLSDVKVNNNVLIDDSTMWGFNLLLTFKFYDVL